MPNYRIMRMFGLLDETILLGIKLAESRGFNHDLVPVDLILLWILDIGKGLVLLGLFLWSSKPIKSPRILDGLLPRGGFLPIITIFKSLGFGNSLLPLGLLIKVVLMVRGI